MSEQSKAGQAKAPELARGDVMTTMTTKEQQMLVCTVGFLAASFGAGEAELTNDDRSVLIAMMQECKTTLARLKSA